MFTDPRTAEEEGRVWSSLFVVLSVVAGIVGFSHSLCFSVAGEALTARLRGLSFKAIMRQVGMSKLLLVFSHYSNHCCFSILGGLIWNRILRVPSPPDYQRTPVKYKE